MSEAQSGALIGHFNLLIYNNLNSLENLDLACFALEKNDTCDHVNEVFVLDECMNRKDQKANIGRYKASCSYEETFEPCC